MFCSERPLEDCRSTLVEWLCLLVLMRLPQRACEIAPYHGDVNVVRCECLFDGAERSLDERLRGDTPVLLEHRQILRLKHAHGLLRAIVVGGSTAVCDANRVNAGSCASE